MNYLHYELELTPGDVVEVTLDKQANVRLLDEMNFSNYKRGERHTYYRGSREGVFRPPPRSSFGALASGN